MRVFACPRSPKKTTSWPANTAFSSCGMTVSSYPSTPSNKGKPFVMRSTALRRISSLTGRDTHPEARSAPSVVGSELGTGGTSVMCD